MNIRAVELTPTDTYFHRWLAFDMDNEASPVGMGATKEAAVASLLLDRSFDLTVHD